MTPGVTLAYARANFEWAISKIENALEIDPNFRRAIRSRGSPKTRPWPKHAERAWSWALGLIILVMVLFLVGTWWWLIDILVASTTDCGSL